MIFEAIYSIQTLSLSLCAQYLEGICKELFTAKSRGGLVVLFIYFYIIYIFSLVFFVEEQVPSPHFNSP